jgi:agmatine deiminase
MVTMNNADLTYWGASVPDIATLYGASNISNVVYTKIYLPLTQNNVVTTSGTNLGYKGSYINYYVANDAVLVPNYNDPNDATANALIQTLYPGRTVVGIDCRNLYEWGGMVHCVTQQQPADTASTGLNESINDEIKVSQNFPNPFNKITTINFLLEHSAYIQVDVYNSLGQIVSQQINSNFVEGNHSLNLSSDNLQNGIYSYVIKINNRRYSGGRMIILKE